MDKPVVADVIFTAALKFSSYPSFFISGPMIAPMADVAAAAEPDMAPNSMFANTFTKAKPAGQRPTNTRARFISRIAIPPLFIIFPAKTKKGIANKAKLSRPVAIR